MVQLVLPNDANTMGNVLGGMVLHWIDLAAAVVAHRHCRNEAVTASIDQVSFLAPISLFVILVIVVLLTALINRSGADDSGGGGDPTLRIIEVPTPGPVPHRTPSGRRLPGAYVPRPTR